MISVDLIKLCEKNYRDKLLAMFGGGAPKFQNSSDVDEAEWYRALDDILDMTLYAIRIDPTQMSISEKVLTIREEDAKRDYPCFGLLYEYLGSKLLRTGPEVRIVAEVAVYVIEHAELFDLAYITDMDAIKVSQILEPFRMGGNLGSEPFPESTVHMLMLNSTPAELLSFIKVGLRSPLFLENMRSFSGFEEEVSIMRRYSDINNYVQSCNLRSVLKYSKGQNPLLQMFGLGTITELAREGRCITGYLKQSSTSLRSLFGECFDTFVSVEKKPASDSPKTVCAELLQMLKKDPLCGYISYRREDLSQIATFVEQVADYVLVGSVAQFEGQAVYMHVLLRAEVAYNVTEDLIERLALLPYANLGKIAPQPLGISIEKYESVAMNLCLR